MSIQTFIKRKSENLIALVKYPFINKKLEENFDLYFFFPFWQIGGGERVHADILQVFKEENTVCFITNQSVNHGFKKEFEAYSSTIELGRWSEKASFRLLMLKKIASSVNRQQSPVVFGCHSPFFYSLIPYLKAHVKVVDLIHAFTFDPNGPENYSLPHVHRLDHRVILGEKTLQDFRKLYQEADLDPKYLERFVIIPNQSTVPSKLPSKDFSGNLKILFVSRNAPEKRPEIFVKIAEKCAQQQIPADFIMVGDFHSFVDQLPPNTTVTGELYDKEKLNAIYRQGHIILVTSWREGFPLVIMEGMGHGVVPVTTAVGEIPTYISSGRFKNGFLIEEGKNHEELVDQFVYRITELSENKALLKAYSKNAFIYAKETFREENFKNSYRKLLLEAPKPA